MKYKLLTSDLGRAFAIGVKVTGFVYIGFFIYALKERVYSAIFVLTILLLILYFTYLRRLFFSQKIEYSKESIRINGEEKKFDDIYKLEEGLIIFKADISRKIYYNHFFSRSRFLELKKKLHKHV